jgi:hypothetical protein
MLCGDIKMTTEQKEKLKELIVAYGEACQSYGDTLRWYHSGDGAFPDDESEEMWEASRAIDTFLDEIVKDSQKLVRESKGFDGSDYH